jgi:hypothetical protein
VTTRRVGVVVIGIIAACGAVSIAPASGKPPPKPVDFETPLTKAGFSICESETTGPNIIGAYAQPQWTVMAPGHPCPEVIQTGQPPPVDKKYVRYDGQTGYDLFLDRLADGVIYGEAFHNEKLMKRGISQWKRFGDDTLPLAAYTYGKTLLLHVEPTATPEFAASFMQFMGKLKGAKKVIDQT